MLSRHLASNRTTIASLLACLLASCSGVADPEVSGDLLPLREGNFWVYDVNYHVRGFENSRDTLRLTCLAPISLAGHDEVFPIEYRTKYTVDTHFVRRESEEHYVSVDAGGRANSIVGFGKDASSGLLRTVLGPGEYFHYTGLVEDTTLSLLANSAQTKRVAQFAELYFDGRVILTMEFQHAFARGIGQAYARYVSDISECQSCVIPVEFRNYELISYRVQ